MVFQLLVYASIAALVFGKIPDYAHVELKELIERYHETCFPRIGVTEEDIDAYTFDRSPKIVCYVNCMMIEAEWMTPDGKIRYDNIPSAIPPPYVNMPIIESALARCNDIPAGEGECDKGYNLYECLHNFDPVYFFFA